MLSPTYLRSTIRRTRAKVRRTLRSPFDASIDPRPFLFHGSHHKVGTIWFSNIFSAVTQHFGLRFHWKKQNKPSPRDDFFYDSHSHLDISQLHNYRGSHLIRDPRDMIISGYFYHLRTNEKWVFEPQEKYGGLGYQAYLQRLDQEAGLMAEIEFASQNHIAQMQAWNYANPDIIEMRYEEVLANEEEWFTRLFSHYGFHQKAIKESVDIALGFSMNKVKEKTSHIRSGQPGEWRKHMKAAHIAAFKELTGDAAVGLGYEPNGNWG